jgi:hypothetical protein
VHDLAEIAGLTPELTRKHRKIWQKCGGDPDLGHALFPFSRDLIMAKMGHPA